MNTTERFIKLHKQASWTYENMLDSTNKSLSLTAECCWRRPSRVTKAELGALHARVGRDCFTCTKRKKICKLENPGDVCMGGRERESVCVRACTQKQHMFACKGGGGTGRTLERIHRIPTSIRSNKPLPESATLSKVWIFQIPFVSISPWSSSRLSGRNRIFKGCRNKKPNHNPLLRVGLWGWWGGNFQL